MQSKIPKYLTSSEAPKFINVSDVNIVAGASKTFDLSDKIGWSSCYLFVYNGSYSTSSFKGCIWLIQTSSASNHIVAVTPLVSNSFISMTGSSTNKSITITNGASNYAMGGSLHGIEL